MEKDRATSRFAPSLARFVSLHHPFSFLSLVPPGLRPFLRAERKRNVKGEGGERRLTQDPRKVIDRLRPAAGFPAPRSGHRVSALSSRLVTPSEPRSGASGG